MNILFFFLPVAVLIGSVVYSAHSVKRGKTPRSAVAVQLLTFLAVCVLSFAGTAVTASAASNDSTPAPAATGTSQKAASSDNGMAMMAAALATGLAGVGGGIAVAAAAPAAIGATSEDPKAFGKALIFVALGEGIAIYGLLISILILNKIA